MSKTAKPARSEPEASGVGKAASVPAHPAQSEPAPGAGVPGKTAEPSRSEPEASGVGPGKTAEPARSEPEASGIE